LTLKKAFDTLNQILLQKLEHYGVRGKALDWFRDYLTGRCQFTQFNNAKSKSMSISCGVPQGSILGPLLFLVYINDFVNIIQHGKTVLFADDTNVLYHHRNFDQLKTVVNSELDTMYSWFQANIGNKLSINVSKTKYIVFHLKKEHNYLKISV
jgi:hypothetical protein